MSQELFVLDAYVRGWLPGTDFITVGGGVSEAAPSCPECGLAVGMLDWLPPLVVELGQYSGRFEDLVWGAGGGNAFLASEAFVRAWENSGLTGLEAIAPVEVSKVSGPRRKLAPPAYYHVKAISDGSQVDLKRSHVRLQRRLRKCSSCGGGDVKKMRGMVIKEGTLSGADIFRPYGHAVEVVTRRFMDFCRSNDLFFTRYLPAEEYLVDW
jgi:hypothetical protein